MIQISLRNHLDAHALKIAEVSHCQLPWKAHLLPREEQRNEDVAGREPQFVGADKMIIEPRTGIAGFDFTKPTHTHAELARQIALGQAPFLPCLFNLPPRLHLHIQDRTFSNGSRYQMRHIRVSLREIPPAKAFP